MKRTFSSSEHQFDPIRKKFAPTQVGCHRVLILLFMMLGGGNLFASDFTADFAAANKLYAEGKFADAAKVYETILQTGEQSPTLLFNYGDAEFETGHLGKAIAAYRKAKLLSPRDPELRANLAFVRNQVAGTTLRESRWQYWLSMLSLNEGTLLTIVFFWALFALLVAKQLRPALAPKLQTATRFALVLTIGSGAILALQTANHFSSPIAVVINAEVTARSGPFDDAQNAFTARDGAELRVLDRHDDWVQVASGTGKTGWLSTRQVEVLPGV